MKKLKNLVILCGGTGGHFFPGLSIARIFKNNGGKVALITGKHKINYAREFSPKYNIPIYEVQSCQITKSPLKLIGFAIKTAIGFGQSLAIFIKNRPDAVLAMGSYTSLPSSLAAIFLRIPLFLHDGNSVIGKANCFLSKWSKALMSAFPPVNKNLDISKIIVTGMPLRPELAETPIKNKEDATASFNKLFAKSFDHKLPTILVFGGSLGAKKINTCIPESLNILNRKDIQVIHLTGKEQLKETEELYKKTSSAYLILDKFDNMALLYKMADVIICRSGGSTIAELHYFDKNSILIPYPMAAENHQYFNAKFLQEQNPNTVIIEDKNCLPELLSKEIFDLLQKKIPSFSPKKNPALTVLSTIESKLTTRKNTRRNS